MRRIYEAVIKKHFEHYKQMLFLAGPRQVGKTTISLFAKKLSQYFIYLNWDNQDHRQMILKGPTAVANIIQLEKAKTTTPIAVFDELHKYRQWKTFLKGFFDTYREQLRIIVTGSSKLDIYRTSGDSLMGRYFPYRIHPFSVAECLRTTVAETEISPPKQIKQELFNALFEFGGFPEPFLNQKKSFSRRWKQLRKEQLFRGDIRDLSRIQEIDQLEILSTLIKHQAGQLANYSNLANKIKVSVDTIRRWINTLNAFYYSFIVRPWSKNISRSLLKEPKIYLWDWSQVEDVGQRAENFIASHLLKAIHFWNDSGFGNFDLYFLRTKDQKEVDFLITKERKPWLMVEVKSSGKEALSPNLLHFQKELNAPHVLQVAMDLPYIEKDCF